MAGDDRTSADGVRAEDGRAEGRQAEGRQAEGRGHWKPLRAASAAAAGDRPAQPEGAPAPAGTAADDDRAAGASAPRGVQPAEPEGAPAPAADSAPGAARRQGGRSPRRRRRRGVITAVVLLVLALVAGGACAGAELYTRSRVVSVVRSALPGLAADARVSTQGLVLPQVLRGELDSLSVTASELDLASGDGADGQDADAGPDGSDGSDGSAQGGLRLLDVEASLTSVGLSDTFPAGSVDATASVGWDQVTAMVAAAAPDAPAMAVQAGALGSDEDPGTISASTSVLGLSASLTIVPTVTDDGGLLLDVTSVTVRGTEFDTDAMIFGRPVLSYVGLDTHEIRVGAESLPQGLTLTRVAVTDKGLRLALSGTDVELANM